MAADLTNQPVDSPHLEAMIEQVLAITGRCPRELSAPRGRMAKSATAKDRMSRKLRTKRG